VCADRNEGKLKVSTLQALRSGRVPLEFALYNTYIMYIAHLIKKRYVGDCERPYSPVVHFVE
jgi:hypothetical protein